MSIKQPMQDGLTGSTYIVYMIWSYGINSEALTSSLMNGLPKKTALRTLWNEPENWVGIEKAIRNS